MVRAAKKSRARRAVSRPRVVAGAGGAVELDKLIHDRVRLGVMSALAVNDAMTFRELRELLGTSDGNLSVHARKLEQAGYLACRKSFDGRVPKTEYSITSKGRRQLATYLDHMEAVIKAARP